MVDSKLWLFCSSLGSNRKKKKKLMFWVVYSLATLQGGSSCFTKNIKWHSDLCWVLLKKVFNQVFCPYTVQKVALCSCTLLQKAKKVLPCLCWRWDPKLLLDGNWELLPSHGMPSTAFHIEKNHTSEYSLCILVCISAWYSALVSGILDLQGVILLSLGRPVRI